MADEAGIDTSVIDPITDSGDTKTEDTTIPDKVEAPNYTGTKHRIKIDENEQEIAYEDLIKGYQKSSASDKKFREASEIRKKVDDMVEELKTGDHRNLIKIFGKEQARKMAEELMLEEIEYDQLPEHEKTIKQLQKEKSEAEAKLQERENQDQTYKRQQLEHQVAVEIETEIVTAIKESKAKVTPRLVARMAEIMEAHIIKTGDRIPAAHALKYVRGEIPKDFVSYVSGLSKEDVLALKKDLPKAFLDVLRRDDVDAVLSQSPIGNRRPEDQNPSQTKPKQSSRRMSTDDWFNKMEKRLSGD